MQMPIVRISEQAKNDLIRLGKVAVSIGKTEIGGNKSILWTCGDRHGVAVIHEVGDGNAILIVKTREN